MKYLATKFSALCVLLFIASPFALSQTANAQDIIGYWNFNDNEPESNTNWTQPITANQGSGEITFTVTQAYSFGGTSTNTLGGDPSGGSFVPRGGVDQENNGESFTISASTAGLDEIYLSFATRGTSTGFNSREIQYTTNGTDWISKETLTNDGSYDWEEVTIDFTDIPEVNDNPDFAVRIVLNGATSENGNNRFDNIIVQSGETTIAPATDVASIAELRNGETDGTRYRLTGEALVHFTDGFEGRRMLVDGTAGIWSIDPVDNFTGGTTIGDGITGLVGTLDVDNNGALIRFILDEGSADATVTSTGNTINPESISIPDLSLEDTGKLVLLEGVTFQETGVFETGTNYTLEDGSGNTLTFRTDYFGADYIDGDIPTTPLNVVGVVGGFGSSPQIFARSSADFEEVATVANIQIIHNSPDPAVASVDVYVDGTLTLEDVAFRSATDFIELPSNTLIDIGLTPTGQPLSSGVTFQNNLFEPGNYYVVASGVLDPSGFQANPSGEDIDLELITIPNAELSAPSEDEFSFRIHHGTTDARAVDVSVRGGSTLASDVVYGTTTADYTTVDIGSYTIDIAPAGGNTIASFEADANGLGGLSALVLASGFLSPADNQDGEAFGALLVLADGTTALLPAVSTSIDELDGMPQQFALEQNYPNPFNPTTQIEFALPQAADVQIAVYNIVGQRVATLLSNEQRSAGIHSVTFDASNLASGMYMYRIQAGNFTQTRKMTLIK
jgi:hypothetical protein